ncbi:MAG: NADH dehydrogenase (quinone) subunit D [candidate division NC10 bacterium]|nr:NADH dehydrogenase (quinone) subunit D [candidate division NC10 bacterium]MBI2114563.1 NADH dehydrogenase (quinone) subunit D [candidate division NC10 bacterium]MBI2562594.1 NADH dehydrogenase (quinone) subunit D [candidate division NC10 bacterium]MBI3084975.1 NADH dehydrogenase (quinone) subunit D [candidate division NC10 bacterium]
MTSTRTMTLNMGPQHPSTHGVLRLVLTLDGEVVVKCVPHIGYLHTGIEKGLESKRYQQGIPLTDRMDYLAPLSNNLALVLAVEKALGITVPERAQTIRVLLTELTRIKSHLVWLGTHALDIGAMSVFLYCFREREAILDLYEAVSGQRMMSSYFRVGGLASDLPPGFEDAVKAFLKTFPDRLAEYEALLTANPLWRQRTIGIGTIKREEAIALGLSGPGLRACGVAYDVRRAHPYSGYERYSFDIPLGKTGDVYDRYLVRMAEMRQSHRIAGQALERLTPGPVNVADPKLIPPPKPLLKRSMEALIHHFKLYAEGFSVPAGEVYHAIEAPKGELGCYLVSDGSPRPYRVHFRAPSFVNLQALPKMVEGRLVADVVAVIGSLDIVLGEIDR